MRIQSEVERVQEAVEFQDVVWQRMYAYRAIMAPEGITKVGTRTIMSSALKCMRVRWSPNVIVRRRAETKDASLAGLVTCKRGSCCPQCMRKINAGRANESTEAINKWVGEMDGDIKLITYTFSHTKDDTLVHLLSRMRPALRWFRHQRKYRQLLTEVGAPGSIFGNECTYGHATGWHPHRHELLFVKKGKFLKRHERLLKSLWVKACAKYGLKATIANGVDIRGGDSAGNYIAKLGLEVSLNYGKEGRGKGRYNPMELLDLHSEGEGWVSPVFREYAAAYKGKRMHWWTKSLQQHLGTKDRTDEQVIDEAERYRDTALVDPLGWTKIHRGRHEGFFLAAWKETENPQLIAQVCQAINVDPKHITLITNLGPTAKPDEQLKNDEVQTRPKEPQIHPRTQLRGEGGQEESGNSDHR